MSTVHKGILDQQEATNSKKEDGQTAEADKSNEDAAAATANQKKTIQKTTSQKKL